MKWTQSFDWFISMLRSGAVGILPTDTVWGMCCAANNPNAITHFYRLKRREKDKPTALLFGTTEQAMRYGEFNDQAKALAEKYWPGALTIIVPAYNNVPPAIKGPNKTVGLRVPNDPMIAQITKELGQGLVTGSANFAGEPAPTKKSEINQKFFEEVDVALDGECGGQPPSTVVDCTSIELKVIRQGAIHI